MAEDLEQGGQEGQHEGGATTGRPEVAKPGKVAEPRPGQPGQGGAPDGGTSGESGEPSQPGQGGI